jgi:hypothetical protein
LGFDTGGIPQEIPFILPQIIRVAVKPDTGRGEIIRDSKNEKISHSDGLFPYFPGFP